MRFKFHARQTPRPFIRDFLQSSQGELAKSQHGLLDDAEHGFNGLLAQGVKRPARFGFQRVCHGLGRHRIGKTILRRRIVFVSLDRNEWVNAARLAGVDIPGAIKARILVAYRMILFKKVVFPYFCA